MASSLVAQTVKNLPAMQETQVRSLGGEDLGRGMATHSRTLAWRIPRTEEPGGLQSTGLLKSPTRFSMTFTFTCVKSDGFGVGHLKHPAFSLVFTESISYFASKVTNTDISKTVQSLTRSRESLTLFLDQEVPS